eukprot:TRINITY_DN14097_c0_g2_i1.p1 TRINITY_DN14097_c0_g2~~TRINITY_DN14097_c0_g2_i1.p1  ORF type:complete len:121 (-),score=2.78 TRINITY_DN14097_c0_g2_i1:32-394(-)
MAAVRRHCFCLVKALQASYNVLISMPKLQQNSLAPTLLKAPLYDQSIFGIALVEFSMDSTSGNITPQLMIVITPKSMIAGHCALGEDRLSLIRPLHPQTGLRNLLLRNLGSRRQFLIRKK